MKRTHPLVALNSNALPLLGAFSRRLGVAQRLGIRRSGILSAMLFGLTWLALAAPQQASAQAPDYSITTTATSITVTGDRNTIETMTLSNNGGQLRVATVEARDYSLNGGGSVNFPVDLPIAGVTTIVVNSGNSNDTISVASLPPAYSGSITVEGGGGNSDVVTLSAGLPTLTDVTLNAETVSPLPALTATGNLSVTADGAITDIGNLSVTGSATFDVGTGNDITLNNANNFGSVTITSGNNVTLNENSAMQLNASTVSGTLSATANGAITDSGNLSVTGSVTFAAGAGNNITLNNTNNFGSIGITSGNNVVINENSAMALNASTISGTLSATANGAITDNGNVSVSSTATFAAGAGNDITLNNANNFGSVGITSGNNVTLNENSAMALNASTVSGTLSATANGAITDGGNLSVTGSATFAAGAGNNITLNNANNFGSIGITSGNNVTINENSATTLNASTISGTLGVTSTGSITQSAAISVTSTSSFTTGVGSQVVLNNAGNDFTGAVSVTSTGGGQTNLRDSNAIVLGTVNAGTGTLTVTSVGMTQTGPITSGPANFVGGAGEITLTNAGNDFGGSVTLNNSGANDVSITDTDDIQFGSVTVGTGTLTINAVGISQTAAMTQSGGTGAVTITGNTGSVILSNASNNFRGAVSVTNSGASNVSLRDSDALPLGTLTVGSGTLTLESGAGSITQTGAITQSGAGAVTLQTGNNQTITLTNAGNNFVGNVSVTNNGVGSTSLTDSNAIALGTVDTGIGGLNVIATGAITDVGNLTVGGQAAFTAGAANNITLNNTNNFGSVRINSGNNVTINENSATVLASSTITGSLGVTSTGQVSQSAPISVGTTTTINTTASTVSLNNTGNDFTGAVNITTTLTGNVLVTDANTLTLSGISTGSGGVTLRADDFSITGAISSTGALSLAPVTLSQTIGIGGGAGGLALSDAEIAFLSDGFSGITIGSTAGSGTVTVDTATFTDPVTIAGGDLVDATGTDLTVGATGATLAGNVEPGGNGTVGTLEITGTAGIGNGEGVTFDFTGDAVFDQITATGAFDIGTSVTLTLDTPGAYAPTEGLTYTLISRTGGSGTFNGLAEGAQVTASLFGSGIPAYITYAGGDGDDVVLIVPDTTAELVGTVLTINGTGADTGDTVTLSRTGANIELSDASNTIMALAGMTQVDPNTVSVPFASVTSIVYNGGAGDDTFTVNVTDDPVPASGITFNGDAGADALVVTETASSGIATVTHNFTNNSDGSVVISDGIGTINYTGLAPVTDNLDAVNRVMSFNNAGVDNITLTDNGATLTVDSGFAEVTTFAEPTGSLTINGGTNDDIALTNAVTVAADVTFNVGSTAIGFALDISGATTPVVHLDTNAAAITAAINAGTGRVEIDPVTAATTINLGTGAGALDLTDAEIDFITAGVLQIGDAAAGQIQFGGEAISPAGASTVHLITNEFVDQGSNDATGGAIVVTNLAIEATGTVLTGNDSINMDNASGPAPKNEVAVFSATTARGAIRLFEEGAGGLTINTVDGVSGAINGKTGTNPQNDVFLSAANGNLTVPDIGAVASEVVGRNVSVRATLATTGVEINLGANLETDGGTATMRADEINLLGTTSSATGFTGSTIFRADDSGDDIQIGAADVPGNNVLEISDAELDQVGTREIIIGHTQNGNGTGAGDISFVGPIDPATADRLRLDTDDTVTQQAGATITSIDQLGILAEGSVTLGEANQITGNVAIDVTTVGTGAAAGSIIFNNDDADWSINDAAGVDNFLRTDNGDITITSTGNIRLDESTDVPATDIELAAATTGTGTGSISITVTNNDGQFITNEPNAGANSDISAAGTLTI